MKVLSRKSQMKVRKTKQPITKWLSNQAARYVREQKRNYERNMAMLSMVVAAKRLPDIEERDRDMYREALKNLAAAVVDGKTHFSFFVYRGLGTFPEYEAKIARVAAHLALDDIKCHHSYTHEDHREGDWIWMSGSFDTNNR